MIDEKYKGRISIICISLTIVFMFFALFTTPQKDKAAGTSYSKEYTLDKDKITEINIEIKDSDWKWLLENATKEEYRSGNITINGETFYNVGVRPKGNSSLSSVASNPTSDRFSFKIDFGQYMKGQTYHGFEKLALNNMMSDTTYMKEYLSYDLYDSLGVPVPEYSYSNIKINGKDWGLYLAVEAIEKNFVKKEFGSLEGNLYKPESMEMGGGMGAPDGANRGNNRFPGGVDQRANRVPNGEAQVGNGFQGRPNQGGNGAPAVLQNPAKEGGAQNGMNGKLQGGMPFGNNSGGGANLKYTDDNPSSYSTVRDSAVFKTTTDKDFHKVIDMIKNLNNGTNLEKYLDVEEILKYFAVNTFLVNLDSYSGGMYHNYYLYEKDGKFKIIPWDLNMSFAGFSMGMGVGGNGRNNGNTGNSSSAQTAVNFPIDNPVTGSLENAPLIGNLLKIDKYKELYHSYLEKIVEEYVNSGRFENSVSKLDNLIGEYVKTDSTAFYSYDEYKKSLPELISFGKDRATSVASQLSGKEPSTSYGNIETQVNLSSLGSMQMGGRGPEQGGQMPAAGGERPDMGGQMPNIGNGPLQENMMEIFNIIGGADINNLSPEQKEKLKALGVDDAMINSFKNMPHGGMTPINNGTAFSENPMNLIAQVATIIVILSLGLIFVFKFKRKRPIKIRIRN